MAVNQNPKEIGWFYHTAPKLMSMVDPKEIPPASQIPGLSDLSSQPEENQRKMWIKETDSDYIRLAKMGGRQDLLRHRSPKPKPNKAKGYPRVEWFYQDDIMMEEAEKNKDVVKQDDYQFMLPDYMVHQDRNGQLTAESTAPRRAPYAYNETTIFQTEGSCASDKRVRIPELKKEGYGVRADKPQTKYDVKKMPAREKPKIHQSELDSGRPKYEPMPLAADSKHVMSKVLSHGYVDDWNVQRKQWEQKQSKIREQFEKTTKDKMQSEYQQSMGTPQQKGQSDLRHRAHQNHQSSANSQRKSEEEESKDLFKLSKFKNVQARTDSHRQQYSTQTSDPPSHHAVYTAG